jgi:hypothetical protein
VGGQDHALPRPKDPVPIVEEAGWTSEPVWTGEENLAPTGIRSPDRPDYNVVAIPTELSLISLVQSHKKSCRSLLPLENNVCVYKSRFFKL